MNKKFNINKDKAKNSYFNFSNITPKIKGVRFWLSLKGDIMAYNTDDYFSNIDIKNGLKRKPIRHDIFFIKDSNIKDEITINRFEEIQKIKMAYEHVENFITKENCDFKKKCFWISYNEETDLSPILKLNDKNIYVKDISKFWNNYSIQKNMILLLNYYYEEIIQYLKKWTDNRKFISANEYYEIIPVYNKMIIFSFSSTIKYFHDDLSIKMNMYFKFIGLRL